MHVFFSVGEPSGDTHAAELIRELRARRPDLEFSGFGGPQMREAGCRIEYQLTDLAVVGFLQVFLKLTTFIRVIRQVSRYLRETRPDVVVLVDYPGFNWLVARRARKLGLKVVYYMPPQLWAWGPWRIRRVRKNVDLVLCGLPFEAEWYQKRGIDAQCVGHPIFDEVAGHRLDAKFVGRQRRKSGPVVGILPGSRDQEVAVNWPIQLRTMQLVQQQVPAARFLVACFKQQHLEFCRKHAARSTVDLNVEYCVQSTSEIIEAADVCLMVSGSVCLELLSRATPAVVLYRVSRTIKLLGRILLTCKYFTLANLVAGHEVMPEFMIFGNPARPITRMADILTGWLTNRQRLAFKTAEIARLRDDTVTTGATSHTADAILKHLPFTRRQAA